MGKNKQNTFSWCLRCDQWHWDHRIKSNPFCQCGAKLSVGTRRSAWASGPPPPWRTSPSTAGGQHQQQQRPQQPPAPVSLHQTFAAAGIDADLQALFAKLLVDVAAARGQAGAGLVDIAASFAPAPVVPPTAKQKHEQASAEMRQALKTKQDLSAR